MYKELIISIIVVGLIVVGNIITQNNTTQAVEQISSSLTTVREEIQKPNTNQEQSKKLIEEADKIWQERYETMAYYIEHNELEKVETELTKLKANIDMEEYAQGVENLDNCVFILENIKDKTALKILNIF